MDLAHWIERHAAFAPDKLGNPLRRSGRRLCRARRAHPPRRAANWRRSVSARATWWPYLGCNHPEMLALLFACARLGAILLPLNWRLAAPEHARILADAEPRWCSYEPTSSSMRAGAARGPRHAGWRWRARRPAGAWTSVAPGRRPSPRSRRARGAGAALLHVRIDRGAQGRGADPGRAVVERGQQHRTCTISPAPTAC